MSTEPIVNGDVIAASIARSHARDQRQADALIGAQIGPWRVGEAVLGRYKVTHERDNSTRLLLAVDLLALAAGAAINGAGVTLAREPAPPKPMEAAPLWARHGQPIT